MQKNMRNKRRNKKGHKKINQEETKGIRREKGKTRKKGNMKKTRETKEHIPPKNDKRRTRGKKWEKMKHTGKK